MVIYKKLIPGKVSHEIDLSYLERLEAAFLRNEALILFYSQHDEDDSFHGSGEEEKYYARAKEKLDKIRSGNDL